MLLVFHWQAMLLAYSLQGPDRRGEGESKVRKHGWSKPPHLRKVHLAMDAKTDQICAALMTHQDVGDRQAARIEDAHLGSHRREQERGFFDQEAAERTLAQRAACRPASLDASACRPRLVR